MSAQLVEEFLQASETLMPALNQHLDAVGHAMTDADIVLGQLGELASEILIEDRTRTDRA
jgi:ABC-type transporter Mla subunit MlaD